MAVNSQDLKFQVLASVVGAQAIDQLKDKVKSLETSANQFKQVAGALGGLFSAAVVVNYGKGLLDTADSYNKLSQKTGVAVETIAEFAGAALEANVPLDSLAKGLNRLGLNLVQAANGNLELAGIFKNLGISIKDGNGNLRDAGAVAKDLADKFSQLRDGPEKAAIAIKLLGRSGGDLIPFFDQGADSVSRFALAIDTDFATRATAFNDTIKEIGVNLQNQMLAGLKDALPALQEVASALAVFTSDKSSSGFFLALGEGVRQLAYLFIGLGSAVKEAFLVISSGYKEIASLFNGGSAIEIDKKLEQQLKALHDSENKALALLNRNSLITGQGTTDEILARQRAGTQQKQKPTDAADVSAIGTNAKTLQSIDLAIAKVKAETAEVGKSNQERQASVLIAELEAKGLDKTSTKYELYKQKIIAAYDALATAQEIQAGKDFQRTQQEQIDLQLVTINNYDLQASELQKLVEAKTLDNQATEATLKFTDEGKAAYLENVEAIKKQREALIDLQQQQKETYSVGAKEALKDYLDNARDVATQTKTLFTTAFKDMEDALVNFVKTGTLNFSKFADDIITEIIRIQVKALIAQAVTGATGLFSGLFGSGISTTAGPTVAGGAGDAGSIASGVAYSASGNVVGPGGKFALKKYAAGGVATSPQLSVFGEGSSPEAYVPLADGRTIPVTVSGGHSNNVSVNVNVEKGTQNTQSDGVTGAKLGQQITKAIQQEIVKQKRPGGLLA